MSGTSFTVILSPLTFPCFYLVSSNSPGIRDWAPVTLFQPSLNLLLQYWNCALLLHREINNMSKSPRKKWKSLVFCWSVIISLLVSSFTPGFSQSSSDYVTFVPFVFVGYYLLPNFNEGFVTQVFCLYIKFFGSIFILHCNDSKIIFFTCKNKDWFGVLLQKA